MTDAAPQRLTELFEHAIALAPDARDAWIAAACGDDDRLRAKLERLLRADERAAHFLEQPPALIADAIAGSAGSVRGLESPQQFGPYRVLRSIGIGGMGEVWLAERSDGEFEQRVAIKQLAYPTPGLLHRFRQERQILAHLEHANIARLIDGGVDAAGAPYLVMEYVEGMPLIDYARERELDLRARLQLFLRVCEGVQYAHQNLVVHRDLKPSNIFVTATGEPKLLDFGIAKVLASTDEAEATRTVGRLFTPGYAAPEQFVGGTVTTATDVYALGVVLYELLAGKRPARSTSGDDEYAATEPPPPSAAIDRSDRNAGARRRALRGDLDRVVLTALAVQPQRRYPSAEALANDIRRYLDGRPVSARGDGAWYRFRKFSQRNRYALGAASVVLLVSVLAAIVSLDQARRARDEAARGRIETAKYTRVAEFVSQILSGVDPDRAKSMDRSLVRLLLDSAAKNAKIQLADQPAVRASIEETIASGYESIGEFALADAHLNAALQAAHQSEGYALAQPRLIAKRSNVLQGLGRYKESHALAEQAVALTEGLPPDNRIRLIVESRLASSDCLLFRRQACRERFARVYPLERRVFGENDEETLRTLSGLAYASVGPGTYGEAKALFVELIERHRERFGEDNSRTLNAVRALALIDNNLGEYAESERLLRSNLPIAERALGEHQTTAEMLLWLGVSLRSQNRYLEARPVIERALALLVKINGPQHFVTLSARHALAALFSDMGEYKLAEQQARELKAAMQAVAGGRGDHGAAGAQLARILIHQKRFAEAEDELDQAWSSQQWAATHSSQEPTDLIRDYMALYAAWGKPDAVEQWRARLPLGAIVEYGPR